MAVDSLGAGIADMRKQTDEYGNPIDISPVTLLLPPELEMDGKTALESEYITRANDTATGNPLRNALKLAVEPRLSNSNYTGNSALAWYLFGSTADAPVIVVYLIGRCVKRLNPAGTKVHVRIVSSIVHGGTQGHSVAPPQLVHMG